MEWSSINDPQHNGKALAEHLAKTLPSITSSGFTDNAHTVLITFKEHNDMREAYQLLIELLVTGQRL